MGTSNGSFTRGHGRTGQRARGTWGCANMGLEADRHPDWGEGQHHLKKHDIGEKQLLSQLLRRKKSVKNRQRIFLQIKRSPDFIPAEQRRDEASHTEGCARSTPGGGMLKEHARRPCTSGPGWKAQLAVGEHIPGYPGRLCVNPWTSGCFPSLRVNAGPEPGDGGSPGSPAPRAGGAGGRGRALPPPLTRVLLAQERVLLLAGAEAALGRAARLLLGQPRKAGDAHVVHRRAGGQGPLPARHGLRRRRHRHRRVTPNRVTPSHATQVAPGPPLPVQRSRPAPRRAELPEGAGQGRAGSSRGWGRSGSPGLCLVLQGQPAPRPAIGAEGRVRAWLQPRLFRGPSAPSFAPHGRGTAPATPHQASSRSGPSLQGAGSEIPQSCLQNAGRAFQEMCVDIVSLPQPARTGGSHVTPYHGARGHQHPAGHQQEPWHCPRAAAGLLSLSLPSIALACDPLV